jgi:type IV secretion system protein TrbJ
MKKIIQITILLAFVVEANATMPVFDYAGLTQQLIHYVTMCNQYTTQTQQYARQLQQLQNEYRHLQNLDFQADISGLDDMKQLAQSALGMSNEFAQMQAQFEREFPGFNTYQTQSGASYAQQAAAWSQLNQKNALDILRTSTKLQESMYRDQDALRTLSDRSNNASGTKDLLQIMNQLLILQTKQLMQLEQLLAATAKSDATYLAENASRQAAGAARSRKTIDTWSTTDGSVVNPYLDRLH